MKMSIRNALLAAAILLAAPGGLALAQTAPKDNRPADAAAAKPQQPWLLTCSNQNAAGVLACTMMQTIVAQETNQKVISATVFRVIETKALRLQLGLPHGLDLTAGISLGVDDKAPVKHVINTADQNGSYSYIDIDNPLLAQFKAGKVLNVVLTAMGGQTFNLQISLAGFAAALEHV